MLIKKLTNAKTSLNKFMIKNMKRFYLMRVLIFGLLLLLFSEILQAQNDTIVYFSKLNRSIDSKEDAFFYSKLVQGKKGNLILRDFALNINKWENVYESDIRKVTDTSYSYFYLPFKKQIYIRSFTKRDSGYYIRNYLSSTLSEEGLSKTIFPLIRNGLWKQYDPSDGKILSEALYKDNQVITNKYRIPDGTYISDVFSYVEKKPDYEGGISELLKFIGENLKYPEKARENNISGRVFVSFVLMNDGSIEGVRFIQRVNLLLDVEALRVIDLIPADKWKPAEIDNKKVNTPMALPITFSLN